MENIKYIGLLIKRIDDAIGKTVNKELKEKDATFSQMHMLWALKNTKGGTSYPEGTGKVSSSGTADNTGNRQKT